jgi:membrane-bound lytic murein transglycosylase D
VRSHRNVILARRHAVRPLRLCGALAAIVVLGCGHVQPTPVTGASPVVASADPAGFNSPRASAENAGQVVQQGTPLRIDASNDLPRVVEPLRPADAEIISPLIRPPDGPMWDIDVRSYETTTRVEHYVAHFTGPARDYIQTRLSDGTRFEPMIRESLRRGGIPEDMYYLALVESGFDPNAYSRAAAVGMWQFMASTARGMGLRVDWWVDERRDPVRSTKAAVEFIRGLRDQFGSIYLAAAAYNGGPGRIARGLTRYADDLDGTAGDDLFFALAEKRYLKTETSEYVPQIIAAALIAKDPGKYGMAITSRPAYAYDSVTVPALTTLAAIARAAGCTIPDLRALNPQILRGMTPPKVETEMRLPVGSGGRFDSAFALTPDSLRIGARVVHATGHETTEKLAKLTGVSARQVGLFNTPLKRAKSGAFRADQLIYVPTPDAVAGSSSVPDPSIERWGTSGATGTHVVAKGETLGAIAAHFHTTTAALMRMNGLKKSIIFPGQMILVSGKSATPRKVASRSSTKKQPAR